MSVSKKKEPVERQFNVGSLKTEVCSSSVPNSNKKISDGQSITEFVPSEFDTKFAPKMIAKSVLADSFLRLGSGRSMVFNDFSVGFDVLNPDLNRFGFTKRGLHVSSCGTFLALGYGVFEDGVIDVENGRLKHANFCRDRLCPMCNWRRTLKIFGQASKIISVISSRYTFLFLTLTVPNCASEDLIKTLDEMNQGFRRLKRNKRFSMAVRGFHRALEVTINPDNGFYHPHFHLILAVDKFYCTSKLYIKHAEWLQLWRDCMRDQSITQVDIRTIKPDLSKGQSEEKAIQKTVAEVSKYAVKSSDFLGEFDKDGNLVKAFPDEVIDNRVFTLANALRNRQLSVFGGVFFDTLKALNLDDAEDGDLVHLVDDKDVPYVAEIIVRFGWNVGIGGYVPSGSSIQYLKG